MLLRAQHEPGQGALLHEFRQVRAAGPRPDRSAAASESKHASTLLARRVNKRGGWLFAQLLFQGTVIKFMWFMLLPTAREGNVFTRVCDSVHNWPNGYSVIAHPCWLLGHSLLRRGRYASYWNAFLFLYHLVFHVINQHGGWSFCSCNMFSDLLAFVDNCLFIMGGFL